MSNSNFDPASFLNTEVNAEFASEFTPVPEGEFDAQILDVTPRTVDTKNGERVIVGIKFGITDPSVAEKTGLDNPSVKYDIWIDQDDNGALSTGVNKNVGLGKLRKAVKQDAPGRPWSFAQLNGAMARVKVKHRLDDKGVIRAEVADVSSL